MNNKISGQTSKFPPFRGGLGWGSFAWRNLWRNKRRTLITAASVFFAVFLAIIMRGFHSGSWVYLIDNVLHSYSGYVQVHSKGYWENKTFDYTLAANDSVFKKVTAVKGVKGLIPRIESFSLASTGEKSKGVLTVGVDPEMEKGFSTLNKKVISGRFFNASDTGIILSERLAKFLHVKTNDSLVLLSQGYQGASANGVFKIIGIVKLPAPEFDNQTVFMPLPLAQEFFSMPNLITSVVVDINDPQDLHKTVKRISAFLNLGHYEVMSWEEMLFEMYQQYVSDEGGALIILGLLYVIVGFGVFGTVLMMISERKHELGIMVTLGMQRHRLIRLVGTELLLICLIGLVSGVVVGFPVIAYFHFHPLQMSGEMAKAYAAFGMEPVIPVAWNAGYFIQQAINISILVCIALMYPMYSVFKLNLSKALRR